MDPFVFAAVLLAAMMHAGWNTMVKVGLDRFSAILLLALVRSGIALLLLPVFPVPATGSWPWLLASGLLHSGYKLFLIRAYAHGYLAQVYPLARGTAPLLVALVGSTLLGETIGPGKAVAVCAIALGVIVMSLRGGGDVGRMQAKALAYALGTAGFTAAYTIVDGAGMLGVALLMRGRVALRGIAPAWRSGFVAGTLSLGSYWIAIWAFTKAPVALVASLRETSVLFAMLIGGCSSARQKAAGAGSPPA